MDLKIIYMYYAKLLVANKYNIYKDIPYKYSHTKSGNFHNSNMRREYIILYNQVLLLQKSILIRLLQKMGLCLKIKLD